MSKTQGGGRRGGKVDKQVRVGHKFHVYFHLDVAAEKVAEATPVGMWNSEQGLWWPGCALFSSSYIQTLVQLQPRHLWGQLLPTRNYSEDVQHGKGLESMSYEEWLGEGGSNI